MGTNNMVTNKIENTPENFNSLIRLMNIGSVKHFGKTEFFNDVVSLTIDKILTHEMLFRIQEEWTIKTISVCDGGFELKLEIKK